MATILEEQGRKAELKVLDKEIKKIGRKELPHILRVQQTIVKSVDEYMYKKV